MTLPTTSIALRSRFLRIGSLHERAMLVGKVDQGKRHRIEFSAPSSQIGHDWGRFARETGYVQRD
jgi:hypothetical protein